MARKYFCKQCEVSKQTNGNRVNKTAWLPEEFCIVGQHVTLKDEKSVWIVRSVGSERLRNDEVKEREVRIPKVQRFSMMEAVLALVILSIAMFCIMGSLSTEATPQEKPELISKAIYKPRKIPSEVIRSEYFRMMISDWNKIDSDELKILLEQVNKTWPQDEYYVLNSSREKGEYEFLGHNFIMAVGPYWVFDDYDPEKAKEDRVEKIENTKTKESKVKDSSEDW